MELNAILSFNDNCTYPELELTDLFQEGDGDIINTEPEEGVLITKVTLEYVNHACTECNCNAIFENRLEITDFSTFPVNLFGWEYDNGVLTIPSTGGINKLKIKVSYTRGESSYITTQSLCQLNTCDIYCEYVEYLKSNKYSYELFGILESIKYAANCSECCTACELYRYLTKKITNKNCLNCE